MASRRSYKTDESFLEKVSIGAVGTRRVFDDLFRQGHDPIELERGSMSFKIWKTVKIKRIRVPDILCISCGHSVESRAKTKLEITMSHSFSSQERGWDYGLEDEDFVALVVCRRAGQRPVDWQADKLVQYVSVGDLRVAQRTGHTISVRPKGAQEGFEARITWPSTVAHNAGTTVQVTQKHIQYRRQSDDRIITLGLSKRGSDLKPLVKEGELLAVNQVVASVVPATTRFPCSKSATEEEYLRKLSSSSLGERYKASKALSHYTSSASANTLAHKMSDGEDHIYVRLEAASSLARRGDERGTSFVDDCLSDQYLENRLEAVIVLGEIGGQAATTMLLKTLRNDEQHPEIRAGAAWALGELHEESAMDALIGSFAAMEEEIRVEAARALAKLANGLTTQVVDQFSKSGQQERAGIAWALSKSGQFSLEQLLQALVDDDARRWVAYILGTQDPQTYVGRIELLRQDDPEVYFAVSVLWQIMNSWVYGLEEYA